MVVDGPDGCEPEKSSKVTDARREQLRAAEDTRRTKTKGKKDCEKEVRPRPLDYYIVLSHKAYQLGEQKQVTTKGSQKVSTRSFWPMRRGFPLSSGNSLI